MMGKRAKLCFTLCALVMLCGCGMLFPYTAAAIAPEGATVGEAALGVLADIQNWIEKIGGVFAFLFGG